MSKQILVFLLITLCETRKKSSFEISRYEYGTLSKPNVFAVIHMDVIPAFQPLYRVKLTLQNSLSNNISHLIVDYISPISKLHVNFDQKESTLEFYIKFPFVPIPFGAVGFSPLIEDQPFSGLSNPYNSFRNVIHKFLQANIPR